jgi:hypothetical protein
VSDPAVHDRVGRGRFNTITALRGVMIVIWRRLLAARSVASLPNGARRRPLASAQQVRAVTSSTEANQRRARGRAMLHARRRAMPRQAESTQPPPSPSMEGSSRTTSVRRLRFQAKGKAPECHDSWELCAVLLRG